VLPALMESGPGAVTTSTSWREKWVAPADGCSSTPPGAGVAAALQPGRTALPRAGAGISFLSTAGMRVVVSINGVKFRVPITDNAATVGWLCGDVAQRYVRHHKLPAGATIVICELRGSDGSVLDEEDAVADVADDMEELVGILSTGTRGSGDALDAKAPAVVVPEPPAGGAPIGVSSYQHAQNLARAGSAAAEAKVRGATDATLRLPSDALSAQDEHLDSWAREPFAKSSYDGHAGTPKP
jgi:hypothetical protein